MHIEDAHSEEIVQARQRLDALDMQIIRIVKERASFFALVRSARTAGADAARTAAGVRA
ncbi:hypothetical protein ACIHCQ_32290 [Streptomyces sp. NPDC052236]|uniref:hypothetical protein n=1 Tax=Streptomyces sp. NPDC052236 TaxID=3365686 RepID=UPI0037D18E86